MLATLRGRHAQAGGIRAVRTSAVEAATGSHLVEVVDQPQERGKRCARLMWDTFGALKWPKRVKSIFRTLCSSLVMS